MKLSIVFAFLLGLLATPALGAEALTDPTMEGDASWTLCGAALAWSTGHACGPSAHAGTQWAGGADGSGNVAGYGVISTANVNSGNQNLSVWLGGGLGTTQNFDLRMGPGTAACTSIAGFGTQVTTTTDNSCGAWQNVTGTYSAGAGGVHSFIAVSTNNTGWSCGGAAYFDDASWDAPAGAVEDWYLY